VNKKYICKICDKEYKGTIGLGNHLNKSHKILYSKDYYDKWFKKDNEDKCKICEKRTKYVGLSKGYNPWCCKKCSNKYRQLKVEESNMLKYNVKNVSNVKEISDKRNKINIEKFGYKCPLNNPDIQKKSKETCLEKYGVEYVCQSKEFKEKSKQTCLEKYGVEYSLQSKEVREKGKETCLNKYKKKYYFQTQEFKDKSTKTWLKKYGVEYPAQNIEIYNKGLKTKLQYHSYKEISYQGSYELDFLKKYHDKFLDIQKAPAIKYTFAEKNSIYHPDFYIPSLNLIVEIKNSYLAERDKDEIAAKEKFTVASGFNYIIIIDMNYKEFIELVAETGYGLR